MVFVGTEVRTVGEDGRVGTFMYDWTESVDLRVSRWILYSWFFNFLGSYFEVRKTYCWF